MSNIKINDVPQRIQYTATGGQTQFTIPFPFFQNSYVYVWLNGVQIFQGGGAGEYVVTGAGSPSGGLVTFNTAATLNDIVTIEGIMPIDRTSIYSATISNLTGSDLNGDFNREVVMLQQLNTTQSFMQLVYPPWVEISQDLTVTKDRYIPLLPALGAWRMNAAGTEIETFLTPAGGGIAPNDATYLLQVSNSELPNAQVMGSLATGFVINTFATGIQLTRTLTGTTNQIDLTNGNGLLGNPEFSLSSTLDAPGTFTIQGTIAINSIINDNTMATASTANIATSLSIKNYIDGLDAGNVKSVSGTANRITSTGDQNPVIDISASYVGQESITTLGTITTGVWNGSILSPIYGGTGVNNGTSTLTLAGNLETVGSFASIFRMSAATDVTFPTTGTLATTSGTVTNLAGTANQITASSAVGSVVLAIASNPILPGSGGVTLPTGTTAQQAGIAGTIRFNSETGVFEGTEDGASWIPFSTASGTVSSVTGTADRITSTGGVTPVIDIAATYVGQNSITTLGTVSSGTWNATTIGINYGGTGVTSVTTTPTAAAFSGWDTNLNLSANNFIGGFSTTVTAAGTTTLTVSSKQIQEFTGVTTQTVELPIASTLVAGQTYIIINNSTGNLTVNSSGGNVVVVMAANTTAILTCVLDSGTTASSWNSSYLYDNGAGVISITGTANQVIASASTGDITLSLPQSIGTASDVEFSSVSFSSTSGIIGTTTNDNAAAGSVGEVITNTVSYSSRANLTTGVAQNVTSISLTSGDWDVWGNVTFTPAETTTIIYNIAWASLTSATLPDQSLISGDMFPPSSVPGIYVGGPTVPILRVSVSGTTTVYLTAQSEFSTSSNAVCGSITARRRR